MRITKKDFTPNYARTFNLDADLRPIKAGGLQPKIVKTAFPTPSKVAKEQLKNLVDINKHLTDVGATAQEIVDKYEETYPGRSVYRMVSQVNEVLYPSDAKNKKEATKAANLLMKLIYQYGKTEKVYYRRAKVVNTLAKAALTLYGYNTNTITTNRAKSIEDVYKSIKVKVPKTITEQFMVASYDKSKAPKKWSIKKKG